MVKLYALMTVLALAMVSCTTQYSVQGVASQAVLDGRTAYLRTMDGRSDVAIDSCKVLHGKFSMTGPLDSVRCVRLFLGADQFIPIVLEEGDIQIKLENSSIVIGGTPLNDRLYAFLNSRDSLAMLSAELPKRESEMYLEGYTQDEILTVLGNQEFGYRKAMDKLETDFVTSNFDNPLGVMWFMELCHRATMIFGYPTTTPQIDEIYGRAPENFKANPDVVEFMRQVK
jgi:hypothetical protein